MHTLLPRLATGLLLLAVAVLLPAQTPFPAQEIEPASPTSDTRRASGSNDAADTNAELEVVGYPALAHLLAHTRAVLSRPHAPGQDSADLWQMMTALIRLGNLDRAEELLAKHCGTEEPGLVLAAHATWRRLTAPRPTTAGKTRRLLPASRLQLLREALKDRERRTFGSYRDAALQIHGRYCLALLEPEQRREHERIATSRLLALEAQTWQPGRGHFRPRACNGAIRTPAPADATLLQPLTFGMLLATGDRLSRHLANTVAAARNGSPRRWQQTVADDEAATLLLTAAAQLGDHTTMQQTLGALLPRRAALPGLAARDANAALLAITGLRLAAGGGLDTRFVRITPWLPPDVPRLELRGLRAMQHTFDLTLQAASTGPQTPTKDELEVTVELSGASQAPMPLVVGNRQQQVVTEVRRGRPAHVRLPRR